MSKPTDTHKRARLVASVDFFVATAAKHWIGHPPISLLVVVVEKLHLYHLEGGRQGRVNDRPFRQSPHGLRRKSVLPRAFPCAVIAVGVRGGKAALIPSAPEDVEGAPPVRRWRERSSPARTRASITRWMSSLNATPSGA